ncbi:MAG: hypothetical protein P1V36_00100 [Planctomycetota bacterium]|nr:hypothetical protein [Planctomycetota bacterium]
MAETGDKVYVNLEIELDTSGMPLRMGYTVRSDSSTYPPLEVVLLAMNSACSEMILDEAFDVSDEGPSDEAVAAALRALMPQIDEA